MQAPPLAVNLTFFLVDDRSMPSAPGKNLASDAPGLSAPSLATVCEPSALSALLAPGSTSKLPALVLLLVMTIRTISSIVSACPSASFPTPAPMSMPTMLYRSIDSVAPLDRTRSRSSHTRFAWSAPTPSVNFVLIGVTSCAAEATWPSSMVLSMVALQVSLTEPDERLRVPIGLPYGTRPVSAQDRAADCAAC